MMNRYVERTRWGAVSIGRLAMMRTKKLALVTTLTLVCGPPTAMAQSYGATGPARADTRDPNSAPMRSLGEQFFTSESRVYARGQRGHRGPRATARTSAAKPDPALAAQRNTALLMRDAMNPWGTTSSPPAKRR
jgi:hypothetical protein